MSMDIEMRRKMINELRSGPVDDLLNKLMDYQRSSCMLDYGVDMVDRIDWKADRRIGSICRRSFRLNPPLLDKVTLTLADENDFSLVAAQLRVDSASLIGRLTSATLARLTQDDLTEFFFSTRSLLRGLHQKRLYVVRCTIGQTLRIVGFVLVTATNRDASAAAADVVVGRKRKHEKPVFWVDLFSIFLPFRGLGLGKRAALLLPELICRDFPTHKRSAIHLNPLEPAEPFWKSCGFRWSLPNGDGHLYKLPPRSSKRKRSSSVFS